MTLDYTETAAFEALKGVVASTALSPWSLTASYYSSDKELALLARHVYNPDNSLPPSLTQEMVKLASGSANNGYKGAAYWHGGKRQLVVSHCGTEPPLAANAPQSEAPVLAWYNLFGKIYQYANGTLQAAKDMVRRVTPTVKDLITDYTRTSLILG